DTRFSGSNFFPDEHFENDRCAVACGNRGDAPWLPGVPRGATRTTEIGMAFEDVVAEVSLAREPRRISPLEHFPIRLNRRGFPNQHLSDSSCMLVLEASMHGQSPFERSSAACH
ncbi:MAG TPA: hypothetical protein VGZ22_22900, partial [Isosphaeraceae bacterium]|nr:hypothetical protein [Isosphaeraceae bacterium]